MLDWAKEQGYRGVQFNAVVETNTAAVRLWQSLGFEIIGTVPEAFRHAEDGYVGLHVMSPSGAVIEEVAAGWLKTLLRLPADASVGFVTGCHMANFTALAAARHELLRRAGWDVEADGLHGAPRITVFVGDEVHVSVLGALRYLGIGSRQVVRVGQPHRPTARQRIGQIAKVDSRPGHPEGEHER